MTIRELYLNYLKQGLPSKEAAKMVQQTTGRSAVSGKLIAKRPNKGEYRGQYGS